MSHQALILVTGLPGTGKSTLADRIGQQLQIPVFAKDLLEATLRRCGVTHVLDGQAPTSYAVYELLFMLAQRQLAQGRSCVIECVACHAPLRTQFQSIARQNGATWYVIECICSDERVHQERLALRRRGVAGLEEITWEMLLQTKARYASWSEERLIIDAVHPLEQNLLQAVAFLCNESSPLSRNNS
jgi:predicted kinase